MVKEDIFWKENKNLLYFLSLEADNFVNKVVIFVSSPFPIPDKN
jgi:hypothetical protein